MKKEYMIFKNKTIIQYGVKIKSYSNPVYKNESKKRKKEKIVL